MNSSTRKALASTRNDSAPVLLLYTASGGQLYAQFTQENAVSIHFVGFHRTLPSGLFLVTDPRRSRLVLFGTTTKSVIHEVRFSDPFEVAWFHPQHDREVLLFCTRALGCYTVGSESVTAVAAPNYSTYAGFVYSFVDPSITCAASGRDLLFFQGLQLRYTFTHCEESPIVYLSAYAHGFIVGTTNHRISFVQHVTGFKELGRSIQQGTVLSYGIPHPIVWASFSPSGHQIVCNIDHRQLVIVNAREFEGNTENAIINPNIVSHKGPVAAISSCAYKPLFVSCGAEDKTVIVWDYSKQIAVVQHEFSELLTDVSFHPSGDLLAVASSDKLHLLAATVDSLVPRAQWPLFNCLSIVFSNGGHFLVAASHIITFINPYTQEIIATLRGHTGLIHSLSWSPDDKRLVSSGSDGNVIEWNAVTQQQVWSATVPKCDFESSVITDRGTVLACARSDCVHHLFAGRHQTHWSEERIGFSGALFVTQSCVVLGDVLGGVVIAPFPFVVPPQFQAQFENTPQLEFRDTQENAHGADDLSVPFVCGGTFRSHCGRVTRICSSLDGKVLFSAAADSSICVFNVLNPGQVYASSAVPILRCDIPKQQFFLVAQPRFDELQHAIEKLKRDIQKQRGVYEAGTLEALATHHKNMTALLETHEEKKGRLTGQLAALRAKLDDSTVKAALIFQNMETAHLNEAKALTNLYEQKLALEHEKCEAIQKEVDDLKCTYEERIYLLRQQYKASLQEFIEKVGAEQGQLARHMDATRTRIADSQQAQENALTDLELAFDRNRMEINLEYHNKIVALEATHRELVAKGETLKADTQRQDADIAQLKADLERIREKRGELDKEIRAQQHTLQCRTSELSDRDETLQRQAERLDRLQGSNSELEKNKTIMEYRLQEMNDELQPSLDEISRLSAEVEGNSDEIRTITRVTKTNHRTMRDKTHQVAVLREKLEAQRAALVKKRRVIHMFTTDLDEAVALEDVGARAAVLKELYDKFVATQDLEESLKDANETIDDHTRHRKHLQQSVMLLQRQVQQQQDITAKHFAAKSSENSLFLMDINKLQRENRILKLRLDNARSDAEMLETNLRRVRQTKREQQLKQTRARTALGHPQPSVAGDWVKEKSRAGAISATSVVDGRGKYLHSGAKV